MPTRKKEGIARPSPILAAGGVLTKDVGGERRVGVIHRARYDDWTLPKGKVEEGETLAEAALREVEEETGVQPRAQEFLGATHYAVDGDPKIVLFWRMEPEQERPLPVQEEVSSFQWLSVDDACRRLNYEQERRMIGILARPARRDRWGTRPSRLSARLNVSRIQFEGLTRGLDELPPWLTTVRDLYGAAERARDDETAWSALFAAERLQLQACSATELGARIQVLESETSAKLSGWRQDSILKTLAAARKERDRAKKASLLAAAEEILDQSYSNMWRKLEAQKKRAFALGVALAATILLLWISMTLEPQDLRKEVTELDAPVLILITLFGVLGGTFSAMIPFRRPRDEGKRYPDVFFEGISAAWRPAFGAAGALGVFALLHVPIFSWSLTLGFVLALAFAGGFSERIPVGMIERVGDQLRRKGGEQSDQGGRSGRESGSDSSGKKRKP